MSGNRIRRAPSPAGRFIWWGPAPMCPVGVDTHLLRCGPGRCGPPYGRQGVASGRIKESQMSLRIQNNVEAFNAHRNLLGVSAKVSESMERLSSGYRINRAADDAA